MPVADLLIAPGTVLTMDPAGRVLPEVELRVNQSPDCATVQTSVSLLVVFCGDTTRLSGMN